MSENNETTPVPKGKPMNSVERRELRKLIDNEFNLMSQKLRQQEAELRVAIEERIREEHADVAAAANAKLDALKEEQNIEAERFEKLQEEHNDRNRDMNARFNALREEYAKVGVAPGGSTYAYGSARHLFGAEPFEPADISDRVSKELTKLKLEKGDAMVALQERKNLIDREIILGAIQSTEGLAFLEALPSMDDLLPSVEQAKSLVIEVQPVELDD